MELNEHLFIEGINNKNARIFHDLFDRFYNSLVYFSMQYVDRLDIAEDIVQELFVKIWESESRYSNYNSFKNFLYTSVKNASLDWLKHRNVEGRYRQYTQNHQDDQDALDFKIMEEEIYRTLLQVVDELPARCQEIFKYHLQGMKNDEIARHLNLSVLTVKTQKKKAVHYIKKRMGNFFCLLLLFKCI